MKYRQMFAPHPAWVLYFFLFCSASVLAETAVPVYALQVGLLPISTTRTLIGNYQPVRAYLERELKRPVELVSAPNFRAFHANTINGDYDLIVTAGHFGRIAETVASYVPLVRYKAPHRTLLIVAKDQPLKSVQELRGKTVASIDPTALAVNETIVWLRKQGLKPGIDYTLLETPTPVSAAYSVQNHQAAMAITSPQGMQQMPSNIRESVDIFAALPELPSMMWMAHPRMATDVTRIKAALLGFSSQSKEGKQFYEATGYIGLREVTPEESKSMDALAQEVSVLLNEKK